MENKTISYDEIVSNIQEVIGGDEIKQKLSTGKQLNVYWGTAPTKPPHLAYFLPLLKIKQLIRGGCHITILLADVHSFLDYGHQSYDTVLERTIYYELVLTEMFNRIGVKPEEYTFVRGSSYQLKDRYSIDLLRFTSLLTVKAAYHAGTEVVKSKRCEDTLLSNLIYPLMQCLDEIALGADIELGGVDQRKIFMLSRDYIEKLGYGKCAYLMNPLLPSLSNKGKMSASHPDDKISFMDSTEDLERKIKKAFCPPWEEGVANPILQIFSYIVFPILGVVGEFETYQKMEEAYKNKKLEASDLKSILVVCLKDIINPIKHVLMENHSKYESAYPT